VSVNLQRVAALTVLYFGAELLERIAYRAGVTDAAAAADQTLSEVRRAAGVDDDLEAADCSDVLEFHGYVTR
jgi:hypothetical protein